MEEESPGQEKGWGQKRSNRLPIVLRTRAILARATLAWEAVCGTRRHPSSGGCLSVAPGGIYQAQQIMVDTKIPCSKNFPIFPYHGNLEMGSS